MAKSPDSEFNERVMKAFGRALRAARVKAGYKYAKTFAETISVSEWRYRAWERGEYTPTLMKLTQMCRALKVRPDELLPLASEEKPRRSSSSGSQMRA